MNLILPSRPAFWRFVFGTTTALLFLSVSDIVERAAGLGVDFSASRAWTGLVTSLSLFGLLSLLLLALTWSRYGERLLSIAELPARVPETFHWLGALLVSLALVGFTAAFTTRTLAAELGGLGWLRLLVFWLFSLLGMWGMKILRRDAPWFLAWIAIVLSQSTFHLLLLYWQRVTDYPFSMGWSETSRYYQPSFFLS